MYKFIKISNYYVLSKSFSNILPYTNNKISFFYKHEILYLVQYSLI